MGIDIKFRNNVYDIKDQTYYSNLDTIVTQGLLHPLSDLTD